MPTSIIRHAYPTDGAEEEHRALRQAAAEMTDGLEENPRNLEFAFMITLTEAESRCASDPLGESAQTWRAWVAAMQVGSALFDAANASGGRVETRIAGVTRSIPATGPNRAAHAGNWIKAFWLAVVCREQDRMARLCDVPISLLRASGAEFDEYVYTWIDTLQSHWLRRDGVGDKLVAASAGALPQNARIASADLLLMVLSQPIELFRRYLRQDAAEFDKALEESLRLHKEYWTADEDRALSSEGLVALGPLAMACLAHDAEMPLEVTSDYLPEVLVKAEWVGEFDA
ncbi:immunity 49 family protein [Streptomyces sp. UH6]|uniref:immunity 49 family protein n=1 Tax=Streptomyces sp. UH6 TaxID=2748379 RepID=UPI0015D47D3F|nr:immunity 49 family protein [Streptomyces sp. UH6]NYV76586.1 immunity 49 family protein [Streptomyces sp. UH6]